MTDKYQELSRAQLTCDYLHANSITHDFIFGALAELVDNARDAQATLLNIYTETNDEIRGGFMLCFLDNGIGMNPGEAADIIHLGKSIKRASNSRLVGQFGNGLKSGSMRIGMDFILFTKKDNTMTCILMSRTFYEKEGIDEVIVPMPSWYVASKEPMITEKEKFSLEIALVHKYSPFKKEFDVMQQFNKITGASGTLVVIYNVKLNDDGVPELDIETDTSDIRLTGKMASGIQPEQYSFRAYAAILYIDPRMKIFIQGQKIHANYLVYSLYRPRRYIYIAKGFKVRALREVKDTECAVKIAEEHVHEARFKVKELEKSCDGNMEAQIHTILSIRAAWDFTVTDVTSNVAARVEMPTLEILKWLLPQQCRSKLQASPWTARFYRQQCENAAIPCHPNPRGSRKWYKHPLPLFFNWENLVNAHSKLSKSERDLDIKRKQLQEKLRALKVPRKLTFIFGVNVEKRNLDGMFIYNNSRLIKMYKRTGIQLNHTLRACSGVVGVVDVPSVMMEPTHNKQDFANAKEYSSLLRIMGQFLFQYWKDLGIVQMGVVKFWNELGYLSTDWNLSPSNALQYKRKRAIEIPVIVQCDICLKWRCLLSNLDVKDRIFSDFWVCSKNTNPQQNSCDLPEQLPHIPFGTPLRGSVMSDERKEFLEKAVQRHWDKVAALQFQKTSPVKPLTYKFPSDLDKKSISKDIASSESNPFPLPPSTRKRRIPSFHTNHNRRSKSSERIPLSQSKYYRSSRNGKTIRIYGKSKSAVSLEKQSYNSVDSTEEAIVNTLLAPVSKVQNEDPILLHSDYMTEALVKDETLKNGCSARSACFHWEVKENVIVSSGSERFQNKSEQDGSTAGLFLTPCSIVDHVYIKKPGIGNETVERIVSNFRNLLIHFLPPNYHISKEKLNCMAAEELVTSPMHQYFFNYEKSLREQLESSSENLIRRAQELEEKIHQAVTKLKKAQEKLTVYQQITVQLLNEVHSPVIKQSKDN
ncbi:ATPase MORC2-like [Stegostoma tigrinum]|uniref:ATPase MORC2-like n=1 Tax=Stegostoma tigrinum TaxID=3053191 RepID=UPI00286FEFE8|nr:ATPase MORC2-like [Stegostoma tigrinum]